MLDSWGGQLVRFQRRGEALALFEWAKLRCRPHCLTWTNVVSIDSTILCFKAKYRLVSSAHPYEG
jgi:hypothetical protein